MKYGRHLEKSSRLLCLVHVRHGFYSPPSCLPSVSLPLSSLPVSALFIFLSVSLFHSSIFWWRSMVLHVLVKGLAVWDLRSCFVFKIRWVQVATQDDTRAKLVILSEQNVACETLNCPSVVNHHPPKPRINWYCCLSQSVRYCHSIGTYTHMNAQSERHSTICSSVEVSYTH